MKQRVINIDLIRAITVVVVMVTHSLALFLGPWIVNGIWNYLHFVVPAFVFCSGYVAVSSFERAGAHLPLLMWYRKRFFRLYIPYALYVLVTMLLGTSLYSSRFLIQSVFLTGGVDVGWLTLLFLQLSLLTPVYYRLSRHSRATGILMLLFLILSYIFLLNRIPPGYSRALAWIPWSLPFITGILFAQFNKKQTVSTRTLGIAGIVCIILWFMVRETIIIDHQPVTLTIHKYPPDFFYFLYSAGINCLLLAAIRFWKYPVTAGYRFILFVSKHSYAIFFVHLVILQLVTKLYGTVSVIPLVIGSVTGTLAVLWVGICFSCFRRNIFRTYMASESTVLVINTISCRTNAYAKISNAPTILRYQKLMGIILFFFRSDAYH